MHSTVPPATLAEAAPVEAEAQVFPAAWDSNELEMEAGWMEGYLAGDSGDLLPSCLDDLAFTTECLATTTDPLLPPPASISVNIKAEYDATQDRLDSCANASAGWTHREGDDDDGDDDDALDGSVDGGDDAAGGGPMSSKRRRRIRNLKQQELNRLAQQRYRQRKKKKHTDLQSALDALTEKLALLDVLGREAEQLRAVQALLRRQLAAVDAARAASESTVVRQGQTLAEQQVRLDAQARVLVDQQAALVALRTSSAAAAARGGGGGAEGGLVYPSLLCEQVLCMVKAALQEVSLHPGGLVQAQAQDAVMQHLTRSLGRCCIAATQATLRAADPLPAPMTVSCC